MCNRFFPLKYSQVTKLPLGIKPRIKTSINRGLNAALIKIVARQDEVFPRSVSKHRGASLLNKIHLKGQELHLSQSSPRAQATSLREAGGQEFNTKGLLGPAPCMPSTLETECKKKITVTGGTRAGLDRVAFPFQQVHKQTSAKLSP